MSGDSILLSAAPSFSLPSSDLTSSASTTPNSLTTPAKDLLERLAFSAGMARVTKLGVYEEQFDEFAEGVSDIPKLLQSVRSSFQVTVIRAVTPDQSVVLLSYREVSRR